MAHETRPEVYPELLQKPGGCKCGFVLLLKGHFRDMSVWWWFEPHFEGIWACDPPDVVRTNRNAANRHLEIPGKADPKCFPNFAPKFAQRVWA